MNGASSDVIKSKSGAAVSRNPDETPPKNPLPVRRPSSDFRLQKKIIKQKYFNFISSDSFVF